MEFEVTSSGVSQLQQRGQALADLDCHGTAEWSRARGARGLLQVEARNSATNSRSTIGGKLLSLSEVVEKAKIQRRESGRTRASSAHGTAHAIGRAVGMERATRPRSARGAQQHTARHLEF